MLENKVYEFAVLQTVIVIYIYIYTSYISYLTSLTAVSLSNLKIILI